MKLKVGDRVAYYADCERKLRTIKEIVNGLIIFDTGLAAHPKQCRRIKKKEPKYYWAPVSGLIDCDESGITEIFKPVYVKVKIVKE